MQSRYCGEPGVLDCQAPDAPRHPAGANGYGRLAVHVQLRRYKTCSVQHSAKKLFFLLELVSLAENRIV